MSTFATKILNWHDQHGRKDLPWQHNPTPYRVWVSEIMLQQTQVSTVIPYYLRFMDSFPSIKSLALAESDKVMQHWAGLGYYARARNLHKSAKLIQADYSGTFPQSLDTIKSLPGIGKSTAGAILSLSMHQRAAILDGNVKRVLSRFFAIDGWTGSSTVLKKLWQQAEQLTPTKHVHTYNQAMMDMGATVCTRPKPNCIDCPLNYQCLAYASGNPTQWPHKKPRKKIPIKSTHMLICQNQQGELLLQKRPPVGIWGGLWSLPELNDLAVIDEWTHQSGIIIQSTLEKWPERRHTFSHYHLDITPILIETQATPNRIMDTDIENWFKLPDIKQKGLAKPISDIIQQLQNRTIP